MSVYVYGYVYVYVCMYVCMHVCLHRWFSIVDRFVEKPAVPPNEPVLASAPLYFLRKKAVELLDQFLSENRREKAPIASYDAPGASVSVVSAVCRWSAPHELLPVSVVSAVCRWSASHELLSVSVVSAVCRSSAPHELLSQDISCSICALVPASRSSRSRLGSTLALWRLAWHRH
jgi:hypothetical protein